MKFSNSLRLATLLSVSVGVLQADSHRGFPGAEVSSGPIYIPDNNLYVPPSIEGVSVGYENQGFFIEQNTNRREVDFYDLAPELRGITGRQLTSSFEHGYISVAKVGEDYALTYKPRTRGGGLLLER